MAQIRALPFIWFSWIIALFGWILLLAGAASLQQDCGSSSHDSLVLGGAAGYLGPIECSKFYAYLWWITWYLFLVIVIVPSLASAHAISMFRAGLLGLLAPLTMLVNDTANTFLFWNHLNLSGKALARARTVVAGSIIASIGLYTLIIMIGLVDEKKEKVQKSGEPTGETFGGRYVHKYGGETMQYNPTFETPATTTAVVEE